MGQHRALGRPGRARGVLDLGRVARLGAGQRGVRGPAVPEPFPPVEEHHLAQVRQVRADRVEGAGQRDTAVLPEQEQPGGAAVGEHVPQLGLAQGRVDRDQGPAGQGGAELQQHPFGNAVGPHRDPLPGPEPGRQDPGHLLGLGQQLGVGPAAASGRIGHPLDQRLLVRGLGGGPAQQAAHGLLLDPLVVLRLPLGQPVDQHRAPHVTVAREPPEGRRLVASKRGWSGVRVVPLSDDGSPADDDHHASHRDRPGRAGLADPVRSGSHQR